MFAFLSGGTGTPKLLRGFLAGYPAEDLAVVVNTAEDLWYGGNHLSPDIDTVIYLCAGILDTDTWWGIRGDTFETHRALARFGDEYFITVGDRDRATHIARADLLKAGLSLTAATRRIAEAFGVKTTVLPMCDTPVSTMVRTPERTMHFQEYWVKHRGSVPVLEVLRNVEEPPKAPPEVLEVLRGADVVILGPSNPVTSILPILECEGVAGVLETKPVIAISPFIGDRPVSGPAADLMRARQLEPSSAGVHNLYRDFVDVFVQDIRDTMEVPGASRLDTLMVDEKKSRELARAVAGIAAALT
jgi:LPPG:FO 2-phospho-L-lactate transferase